MGPGRRAGRQGGPWAGAVPEVLVGLVAVASFAAAAGAIAGAGGAVVVLVACSACALGVAALLPRPPAAPGNPPPQPSDRVPTSWFNSYWRLRSRANDGISSLSAYHAGLGPSLEHVLATRLSENHGIDLYRQPEAARGTFCADRRDADLWAWVAPDRQPPAGPSLRPGIPPRTLARLVRRLEEL